MRIGAWCEREPIGDVYILKNSWYWEPSHEEVGPFTGLVVCDGDRPIQYRLRSPGEPCRPDAITGESISPSLQFRDAPARFVYTITVRNEGTRTIAAVHWKYEFYSRQTGEMLYRHKFQSPANLDPGDTELIEASSNRPPTPVVSAESLRVSDRQMYSEKVRITRVEYEISKEARTNSYFGGSQ